jgi:hypothetical protein
VSIGFIGLLLIVIVGVWVYAGRGQKESHVQDQ